MSLLSLLIRHALMLCAGFFGAHGIDGSSSAGIITGLLMLIIVTSWSLAEKWLNLKPGKLTDSAMLRTIVGALASQLITAASAYFAVDANQPELLAVAVANATASKFGLQQKLAALGSKTHLLLFFLSVSSVCSVGCTQLREAFKRHQPEIEGILIEETRRLIPKNPVTVLPTENTENTEPETCLEPGPDAAPRCLKITAIPDYGARVAAALR
jgi:hypothetical protein